MKKNRFNKVILVGAIALASVFPAGSVVASHDEEGREYRVTERVYGVDEIEDDMTELNKRLDKVEKRVDRGHNRRHFNKAPLPSRSRSNATGDIHFNFREIPWTATLPPFYSDLGININHVIIRELPRKVSVPFYFTSNKTQVLDVVNQERYKMDLHLPSLKYDAMLDDKALDLAKWQSSMDRSNNKQVELYSFDSRKDPSTYHMESWVTVSGDLTLDQVMKIVKGNSEVYCDIILNPVYKLGTFMKHNGVWVLILKS